MPDFQTNNVCIHRQHRGNLTRLATVASSEEAIARGEIKTLEGVSFFNMSQRGLRYPFFNHPTGSSMFPRCDKILLVE